MQLILELLKKIFIALQGVYTRQETDAALGLKADATALTEEAQRVDTRLAEHDAEIETLQRLTEENAKNIEAVSAGTQDATMLTAVANVAKWQTYATAIQKDLDAETAMQLAQEFSRATDEYLADPTKTKVWYTSTDTSNGTITSTCPYYDNQPTKPVVDFTNVTTGANVAGNPAFNRRTRVVVFLPNASETTVCFCWSAYNNYFFAPKSKRWDLCFYYSGSYNRATDMRAAQSAKNTFLNTAMSAENISATLDSLPAWDDGASHVITFTGSPGIASTATTETFTVTDDDGTEYSLENCPIFDTDDEAQTLRKAFVLAVKKKKWTVEI